MKILVVEDEPLTFQRIKKLLAELRPNWEILTHVEQVQELEKVLNEDQLFDLILCDIHLADGLSFSGFNKQKLTAPIIFITAFDQYALDSFDHNCIDYVLKPIDKARLEKAFLKVEKFHEMNNNKGVPLGVLDKIFHRFSHGQFKKRFLAKSGNKLRFISVQDIACFYVENGLTFLEETNSNSKAIVDFSLNELENGLLDPLVFYRVNRSMIVNIDHLIEMKPYLNGRLLLNICTANHKKIIVARERVSEFKNWINQ
jgi:two-component system response regulator LytT